MQLDDSRNVSFGNGGSNYIGILRGLLLSISNNGFLLSTNLSRGWVEEVHAWNAGGGLYQDNRWLQPNDLERSNTIFLTAVYEWYAYGCGKRWGMGHVDLDLS